GPAQAARQVAPLVAVPARALGPDAKSRVCLHADQIVAAREVEEPVVDARLELEPGLSRLRPVLVLDVGHRQAYADGDLRARSDRGRAASVRLEQVGGGALGAFDIALVAGRIDAEHPSAEAEALGLVDGACKADQVAER